MTSSTRYLGTAAGFGFGVIWMTVGVGSAILVLLCAALGYGVVFVVERERAGTTKRRPASETPASETPPSEDFLVDDFELEHFERRDEQLPGIEPTEDEVASISSETGYGWPQLDKNGSASLS
ncbi:MAG TPA: DUF2273 domain-containing protein [Gaiellaceae bacterium]|nr:DUF2273 domain-containing protein [Gaiellaceae bacterium]